MRTISSFLAAISYLTGSYQPVFVANELDMIEKAVSPLLFGRISFPDVDARSILSVLWFFQSVLLGSAAPSSVARRLPFQILTADVFLPPLILSRAGSFFFLGSGGRC